MESDDVGVGRHIRFGGDVARAQKSSGGNPLSGTSWQLVKFQGPDESTFAPDDRSKYTHVWP
jgi:hypothetical protein